MNRAALYVILICLMAFVARADDIEQALLNAINQANIEYNAEYNITPTNYTSILAKDPPASTHKYLWLNTILFMFLFLMVMDDVYEYLSSKKSKKGGLGEKEHKAKEVRDNPRNNAHEPRKPVIRRMDKNDKPKTWPFHVKKPAPASNDTPPIQGYTTNPPRRIF